MVGFFLVRRVVVRILAIQVSIKVHPAFPFSLIIGLRTFWVQTLRFLRPCRDGARRVAPPLGPIGFRMGCDALCFVTWEYTLQKWRRESGTDNDVLLSTPPGFRDVKSLILSKQSFPDGAGTGGGSARVSSVQMSFFSVSCGFTERFE